MKSTVKKAFPKVTPVKAIKKEIAECREVCVAKPVSVEDARKITENLLINRIIFLNLEDLDIETAQRIIDFIAGSCFAVSGNFQRVSNRIFLITPKNVDILGEIQEMMVLPLGISDG